jgi:hypothetical protein
LFSNPFAQRSQSVALTSPLQQGARRGAFQGVLPLAALSARAFSVKGDRPRTHSLSKKKIMKTNTNSDSNSELKSRTAQLSGKPQLFPIDLAARRYNRGLPTERVLRLLQTRAPRFWELAEVVGKWVWIRFEGKQPPQITGELSELGFHWNNRRQLWQHPCGQLIDSAIYDPRRKYGSYFPADQKAA